MNIALKAFDAVKEFSKLERVLAAVCITAPLFMIVGDENSVRDSISAYYSMDKSVLFYVPLTVAFMLFLTNGIVKQESYYNTVLGVALAGVVLFNHIDFSMFHFFCTGVFFIGNALVILIYSPKKELWFKAILVVIIVAALVTWGLGAISLFWAEWVSLFIIGLHYILESSGLVR
jgi:hypothetical protein